MLSYYVLYEIETVLMTNISGQTESMGWVAGVFFAKVEKDAVAAQAL